ncbi:MAG: Eco57I restriction-modification methylase domain-containing protein [Planctomycetes bacterium]|nr:Eco57I restriction-modification methylase domain-containing protein [Planctomycetota bacterium]MCW8134436.1 Eco57I restriction-modification methylase domain-containing protein [Planctomycetota bacterium]
MKSEQARKLVTETFPAPFEKDRFLYFVKNVVNKLDDSEDRKFSRTKQYIKNAFNDHVSKFERLGTYTDPDGAKLDVLIVHLTADTKLERARTAIRNFVADHLKQRDNKDAALVAFVSPTEKQWRFSYIKMDYQAVETSTGKVGIETKLTPARRFSYIVGEGESCHTAQARFLPLLQDTATNPTLAQIEEAFSVEAVTKEFFKLYRGLFEEINAALEKLAAKDKAVAKEFKEKSIKNVDFAKKLMGQIVFLYFLQKKGWLGVERGKAWGTGPHDFLRRLAQSKYRTFNNFFNDVLEPLFYDTLATDRGHEAWCDIFKCRIPFLNGGLFEALGGYDWRNVDIELPNKLFFNNEPIEHGVTGTGVLDVFDRYNFTVNEAEPLEKEVAIDPEMLGKVFENLIEDNRRKGLGSFYTPREIVHYMCQESLINYLDIAMNGPPTTTTQEAIGGDSVVQGRLFERPTKQAVLKAPARPEIVPRAELETFVRVGEQISHYDTATKDPRFEMPPSIKSNAKALDKRLADITVCDPAVGSGAFPVGMMTEIVRARTALTPYFNDARERTPYHFKRQAIQYSLYGADIDPGAVEIAKLRLWLSLVVDEHNVQHIKPLPNLDYKLMPGNSLLGVTQTLFNSAQLEQIQHLKPQYFDETTPSRKAELKRRIDALIREVTNTRATLDFKLHFSEVFKARGGFDVVIANPPYLESRSPAFSDDLKSGLQLALKSRWPSLDATSFIPRGADLLVYFFETSLRIVSPSGIVAFITQNAWLDTEYGKKFQRFLLLNTHVALVVDSDFKHFDSVEGPNINTVITFFNGRVPRPDAHTTFARFQRSFAPGLVSSSGRKIVGSIDGVLFHQYRSTSPMLRTSKWGLLLTLDQTLLELLSILDKAAKPLARMGATLLSVGQGLNLSKDHLVTAQKAAEYGVDESALIPILTSSDGAPFILSRTTQFLVSKSGLPRTTAKSLAEAGVHAFDTLSTSKEPPALIMPRGLGRHFCALNEVHAYSASFVEVYATPSNAGDNVLYSLWAMMNSSVTWLLREATGRKNLGGGMLKAEAVDLRELPLLLDLSSVSEIKAIAAKLRHREAADTLTELDTDEHKKIDDIVFRHLELSAEMRQQVVIGLRRRLRERQNKSKS